MANVILGLLIIGEQSFYDLIKSFKAGISLFYSASSGSIKRALDGLLVAGLIEVSSVEQGARGRKVYRVTDAGRVRFDEWMEGELAGPDVEDEMLSRLYLLGLLEPDRQATVLDQIARRLEADLGELTALDARLDHDVVPREFQPVSIHQRRTLAYGTSSHRFALDWLRDEYNVGPAGQD